MLKTILFLIKLESIEELLVSSLFITLSFLKTSSYHFSTLKIEKELAFNNNTYTDDWMKACLSR